jgi:hypothetical protein
MANTQRLTLDPSVTKLLRFKALILDKSWTTSTSIGSFTWETMVISYQFIILAKS